MAETLGEALLVLRTDDAAFTKGVTQAGVQADALGAKLDIVIGHLASIDSAFAKAGQSATTGGEGLKKAGASASAAASQFRAAGAAVVGISGQQRAGLTQLTSQLGDISTQFALGARPAQIFAAQIGQVTQAITLLAGTGSKFAAFLTGGWGIALTVALQVLGPFIGYLFQAADATAKLDKALSDAAEGADAFGDAQNLLGKLVDLATGKLKTQNEVLKASIRLQAILAQQQAQTQASAAKSALDAATGKSLTLGNVIPFGISQAPVTGGSDAGAILLKRITDALGATYGRGSPADPALSAVLNSTTARDILNGKSVSNKDFEKFGSQVDAAVTSLQKLKLPTQTFNELAGQLIEYGQGVAKSFATGKVLDTLNGKAIDPLLKPYEKPKKPAKDRSTDIANQQAAALAQLDQEELKARLDLTTDIYERVDLQRELLKREREERIRAIEADKNLDAQQKAARIAYINRLYGRPDTRNQNGDIVVGGSDGLLQRRLNRDLIEQEKKLDNDALQQQIETLNAQAAVTTNIRDRNALEKRALDLQQQIESSLLEQKIANGDIADADAARAQLAKRQAATREGLANRQQGPLGQYVTGLQASSQNINEALQGIEVSALQQLNEGLTDAIVNAKSLGDVFHNVAQQIIADLLRIAIQQTIIKPLADSLFGGMGGGGGGGLFGGLASAIGGLFGGGRAEGGSVYPGRIYAVNERSTAPGLFLPLSAGVIEPPSAGQAAAAVGGAAGAGAPAHVTVEIVDTTGLFETRVSRISGGQVRAGIATYDRNVGGRVRDNLGRFG